jgi:hypothetical protein
MIARGTRGAGRSCDPGRARRRDPLTTTRRPTEERAMSKGMDRKKETKKKAGKTLEEKRAIKQAKRVEKKR